MAVSGRLTIKVHRIEVVAKTENEQKPVRHCVKFTIGQHEQRTKYKTPVEPVQHLLRFDLRDIEPNEQVQIEVESEAKHQLATNQLVLTGFLQGLVERQIKLTSGSMASPTTVIISLSSEWKPFESTKVQSPSAVQKEAVLATKETHRPWFTRMSFYYDKTKDVYNYTTSFPVVRTFARLGESSANVVLRTVSGKTLHDLDQRLVAPVLQTLDNKVDSTISTVFTKLFEGQQLALKTKDAAVNTASSVTKKSTSAISSAASTTVGGVVMAKDFTKNTVVNAASSVYNTASSVTNYTTTHVANVSSSTYGKVTGAASYVVRHIPYLGSKIRA